MLKDHLHCHDKHYSKGLLTEFQFCYMEIHVDMAISRED